MAADAHIVVGLPEIAAARDQLALIVAFEAGARHDVEHAIGTISQICGVAAPLDLEIIDVLGIDLWSQVARDVGVWNLDPVHGPSRLMAPANMQLIVNDIGSRNESVIIARLFVCSAPGVRSMSSRLTTVVGVAVTGTAVSVVAVTVTAGSEAPLASCTWATGEKPEVTVTSCDLVSKSG